MSNLGHITTCIAPEFPQRLAMALPQYDLETLCKALKDFLLNYTFDTESDLHVFGISDDGRLGFITLRGPDAGTFWRVPLERLQSFVEIPTEH